MQELIEMGIGLQQGKVVIHLGACHSGWIGMSKEQALAFAKEIERQARSIPSTAATTEVGETD